MLKNFPTNHDDEMIFELFFKMAFFIRWLFGLMKENERFNLQQLA